MSTIEMALVGNFLVAVDEGRAGQFKGRSLRDINVSGKYVTKMHTMDFKV